MNNTVDTYFFLGIGGIGMSALAKYFALKGFCVLGYDLNESDITKSLESLGIRVFYEDNSALLPKEFNSPAVTKVIYTPAVPQSSDWFSYFKTNDFTMVKRAVLLGETTELSFCYAVAGTHGKTTTSAMLAYLLDASGVNITAFLGGIAHNFGSNLLLKDTEITVVDADEFDRSFLNLFPNVACITSTDADHLDIYKSAKALEDSFHSFAALVPLRAHLFVHEDLDIPGISYGERESSDYYISDLKVVSGQTLANIHTPRETFKEVLFPMPGKHNVLNALVAFAMAYSQGVPAHGLIKALSGFKGISRRFSYEINTPDRVYVDDYAHHPTAINAIYQTLRAQYPNKKITAIFQPHLYSRTQDFAHEFAASLSQFDSLFLLDIYPAREQPIEGITSEWLLGLISSKKKSKLSVAEVLKNLEENPPEVLVSLGAGDIGKQVVHFKKALL